MEKSIFYSWQSDLPNNENRGFIESCIENAIKELNNSNVAFDTILDRDTKNKTGTSDIADSIFDKINSCNIFIADISFIGKVESGKKIPNPNVMIELGYAAKKIGWENVVCVFNSKYGNVENLPFDLRARKIVQYSITDTANKTKERKDLSKRFLREFNDLLKRQSSKESLYNHFKIKVDSEILCLSNDLKKILWGYDKEFNPNTPFELVLTSPKDLYKNLGKKEHLGFTVLKSVSKYIKNLEQITQNPIFSNKIDEEVIASIIELINALHLYETNLSQREFFSDTDSNEDELKLVEGNKLNPDNPKDSYLLLDKENRVKDSGTIAKYKIPRAMKYLVLNDEVEFVFCELVKDIIKQMDAVLESMGNKILIDPATFKMN